MLRDGEIAQLLIDTPRASLLETLVARIRGGLRPAELLRGLTIAGCREVSPYPHVGFKYHAVMMLRSVELSVAGMPDERRWLPLLWTANYFKAASTQEDRFRPWSLPVMGETTAKSPALAAALVAWDRDAADRAARDMVVGGQARSALQTLMLHAARDFRTIGHKTIAAANADRLCVALGSDKLLAEPLVRSLALAVQNPERAANPARHEHLADRDWKANQSIAAGLRRDWRRGRDDVSAARTLLQELRTASSEQAVAAAIDLLGAGVSADTVWEAVTMCAAELVMRRNNIVAVHANTTADAMRYCYTASDGDAAPAFAAPAGGRLHAAFSGTHGAAIGNSQPTYRCYRATTGQESGRDIRHPRSKSIQRRAAGVRLARCRREPGGARRPPALVRDPQEHGNP